MKTGNDDKIRRLEFTAKFIESIKPTEKEDRYTDVKIPGLILAVYPVLVEAQRFPKVALPLYVCRKSKNAVPW